MDRLWSHPMAISRIYIVRWYNENREWSATYAYVFYQDSYYTNGFDGLYNLDVGDRRGGMKVIRAQLPNVQPGSWYAYYQPAASSAGDFTEPALPSGVFSTPGPRATPLFTNQNGSESWKLRGSQLCRCASKR